MMFFLRTHLAVRKAENWSAQTKTSRARSLITRETVPPCFFVRSQCSIVVHQDLLSFPCSDDARHSRPAELLSSLEHWCGDFTHHSSTSQAQSSSVDVLPSQSSTRWWTEKEMQGAQEGDSWCRLPSWNNRLTHNRHSSDEEPLDRLLLVTVVTSSCLLEQTAPTKPFGPWEPLIGKPCHSRRCEDMVESPGKWESGSRHL